MATVRGQKWTLKRKKCPEKGIERLKMDRFYWWGKVGVITQCWGTPNWQL
jgi:hypothetical protein